MRDFWQVWRGNFIEGKNFFLNEDSIIELPRFFTFEFSFHSLMCSYQRILYRAQDYNIFHTGIFTPEGEELYLFCNQCYVKDLIELLNSFMQNPWELQEFSQLEYVPRYKKDDLESNFYCRRTSDFWWCFDETEAGDWMAFLSPNAEYFKNAINYDYVNWWLKKSPEDRREEYKKALNP